MSRLIVIEGLDGAGKRTLAGALTSALAERGATVGTRAFPRYGVDVHADLVHDGLHGRLGGLGESVHGMAILYALDRHGALPDLEQDLKSHDVVLLDRYVASNAAYGAARLHQDAHGEFVDWVAAIEIERFGLPVPAVQILLRVPATVAGERSARREADEARARDTWESDGDLQSRVADVYDGLAARNWLSPWVVSTSDDRGGADLAALVDGVLG